MKARKLNRRNSTFGLRPCGVYQPMSNNSEKRTKFEVFNNVELESRAQIRPMAVAVVINIIEDSHR